MNIVLVGFRATNAVTAIAFCNSAYSWRNSGQRVLVMNSAETLSSVLCRGWTIVRGTNEFSEFSGWQEGLAHIADPSGGVLFVNDTVTAHRHFTPVRQWSLRRSVRDADEATLVGFVDRATGSLRIDELPVNGWVSSYCFYVTHDALRRLGGLLFDAEVVRRCVPGGVDEERFFDRVSPDLRAHLCNWLFGGGWYASAGLDFSTEATMTRKARSIIAEKLLSARAVQAGIRIVDPFGASSSRSRQFDRAWIRWSKRLAFR